MCRAILFKVKSIKGQRAMDEKGKWVKIALVSPVSVGDRLFVHADIAVEKIN